MQFLAFEDLKGKGISYSKPHLWRLIKANKFPRPVRGLGSANSWAEAEIDAFVAQRVAARDSEKAA